MPNIVHCPGSIFLELKRAHEYIFFTLYKKSYRVWKQKDTTLNFKPIPGLVRSYTGVFLFSIIDNCMLINLVLYFWRLLKICILRFRYDVMGHHSRLSRAHSCQ